MTPDPRSLAQAPHRISFFCVCAPVPFVYKPSVNSVLLSPQVHGCKLTCHARGGDADDDSPLALFHVGQQIEVRMYIDIFISLGVGQQIARPADIDLDPLSIYLSIYLYSYLYLYLSLFLSLSLYIFISIYIDIYISISISISLSLSI